jgi:hypothetical protein
MIHTKSYGLCPVAGRSSLKTLKHWTDKINLLLSNITLLTFWSCFINAS